MKIAGITHINGTPRIVMKSDSSLLNQRKPFFMPDWSQEITATECIVLRIGRMGRHIEPCFATRYVDAVAWGLNFKAEDLIRQGKLAHGIAFDNAIAVGEWSDLSDFNKTGIPLIHPIEQTIADISSIMTIRTGDMLFIDTDTTHKIEQKQIYSLSLNGKENLYCRIK